MPLMSYQCKLSIIEKRGYFQFKCNKIACYTCIFIMSLNIPIFQGHTIYKSKSHSHLPLGILVTLKCWISSNLLVTLKCWISSNLLVTLECWISSNLLVTLKCWISSNLLVTLKCWISSNLLVTLECWISSNLLVTLKCWIIAAIYWLRWNVGLIRMCSKIAGHFYFKNIFSRS